jgi:hypothetical protein
MILENPPSALERWLYTNAPAAWISAVIAVVSLLLVLRSKKKPSRLVVRELKNSSLITIWPSVRDQIKISFDGHSITALSQIEVELFNEGSEVIHGPTLTVTLAQKSNVLGTLLIPADVQAEAKISENRVVVNFPYLNPVRDHGQVFNLSILADGDTEQIAASGMGEGWSVRHLPLPSEKQRRFRTLATMVTWLIFIGIAGYFYLQFVEKHYGIPASEISLRAFVAFLPFLVVIVGSAFLMGFIAERILSLSGYRYRRGR